MIHLIAIATYVQTHIPTLLLAVVVTLGIGFAWHGPLFGKQWMAMNNLKQPKKKDMKFSMMLPGLITSSIAALVQAAVLGRTFQIVSLSGMQQALLIATILWLPFTAMVIISNYAWLGKPTKLTILDSAFQLVVLWAIAAVAFATL